MITAPLESLEEEEIASLGSQTSGGQKDSTRARHGNGDSGGVAVAPPKKVVEAPSEMVGGHQPVGHQKDSQALEHAASDPVERFQPPLPDVALAPPRYEAPPAPVLPAETPVPPVTEVEAPVVSETEPESSEHQAYLHSDAVESEVSAQPESTEDLVESPEETQAEIPPQESETPPVIQELAVPKTQPIRVKRNPTPLPPRREEYEAQPDDIPRLDTTLGESELHATPSHAHDASEQPKGPIKLNLPPLGSTVEASSPEDFTRPSEPPVAAEPEIGEQESHVSAGHEFQDGSQEAVVHDAAENVGTYVSIPLADEGDPVEPQEEMPHVSAGEAPVLEEATQEEVVASQAQMPPPLEEGDETAGVMTPEAEPSTTPEPVEAEYSESPVESAGNVQEEIQEESHVEAADPGAGEEPVSSVPMPQFSLHTESVKSRRGKVNTPKTEPVPIEPNSQQLPETKFPQQDQSGQHHSTTGEGSVAALFGSQMAGARGVPSDQQATLSSSPSQRGGMPGVADPKQNTPMRTPPPPEADELDELLSKTSGGGGKSRMGLYFLLVGLGVVVIATIMVFVVGEALLGGFAISENDESKEPEKTLPYEKPPVTVAEETGGGSKEEVKAPEKIDVTQAQPAQRGISEEEDKSTTTLPHNYKESVLIQDSSGGKGSADTKTNETSGQEDQQLVMPSPGQSKQPTEQQEPKETPIADLLQTAGGDLVTSGEPSEGTLDDFDQRVSNVLNGGNSFLDEQMSGAGSAGELLNSISSDLTKEVPEPGGASSQPAEKETVKEAVSSGSPSVFPAPAEGESNLARVRDVIEAFLKAPSWKDRVAYTFQGNSLQPAMEEYYKKVEYTTVDRFSLQLFQIDESSKSGNPYWVYFLSTSDDEQGYPVIVRIEEGNLKVDWEVFSEFHDRHFAKFLSGGIASPHTFRVVLEQKSDYFGSDRQNFSDKDNYLIFEVTPPYGGLGEFSEYAFVEKGSDLADQLNDNIGLSDEPLAVMVTLDWKQFSHGIKHLVVTKYVTEGWLN